MKNKERWFWLTGMTVMLGILILIGSLYRDVLHTQWKEISILQDSLQIYRSQPDTPVIMSWQEYQIRKMRYLPCIYRDSTGEVVNNCGDLKQQKNN
jgi:hypothetical protein